ncbi:MAG: outer membrane beta-barrel family protein, partial [Muribaculaceae bacterium]|nr:outer membrane beta-barrel family protein [Muribaculaceae bacterium]
WIPSLFNSDNSWDTSLSKSLSPWFQGEYRVYFTPRLTFLAYWDYTYSDSKGNSESQTGETPIIYNAFSEQLHSLYATASLTYKFSPKFSLRLSLQEDTQFDKIDYNGSYDNDFNQTLSLVRVKLRGSWKPRSNVSLTVNPFITVNYRKVQGLPTFHAVNPHVETYFNWSQTDITSMRAWLHYITHQVPASAVNNVLQQQNPFLWLKGDPNLKNYNVLMAGLTQTWISSNWLTTTLLLDYSRINHVIYRNYTAASADLGGVILSYTDCGTENTFKVGMNFNLNLFNRRVSLNLMPHWVWLNTPDKVQSFNYNRFIINANAGYNFKNFRIWCYYNGAQKNYYNHGKYYDYIPDIWGAGIAYGNGNIYASFVVQDMFHNKSNQIFDSDFDNYHSYQVSHMRGRCFMLNLSYTFGYGRRVDNDIYIQSGRSLESGVIHK